MRMKCPVCGRFAPEGETSVEVMDLALDAGFIIVERIRNGFSPQYAVCEGSCYQLLIDDLSTEYTPAPGYRVAGADFIKAMMRYLERLKGGSV